MYMSFMKLGGSWKEEENMREGGRGKGKRRGVKHEKGMESLGVRDGGRKAGGDRGKVWKLTDRIGYAQTESQAQAQT